MSISIYNTMTRQKELFQPLEAGKVKMYVCGPTVYDYIHIGNARPAIFFDVVRRYLEYAGYDVNYITNFTDIDDRLIQKAEQLGTTVPEVAERFIAAFHDDVQALGVKESTKYPRVTEHVAEIITFITGLIDKGHAYESEGDVYFNTSTFADYGKLSHQKLDELQFGIRIETDERKHSEQDFVLWKTAKPGEMFWDSPWGQGRPGWHIECSAMARTYLGDTLDIHGGGSDLQFPHHECEVAQSEALTGQPFANYWMHNGYINIDNVKMSKSLGNGISVHELVKQIEPRAIRYFMLATHYRSPLNFSTDTIKQAENSVERIDNCINNLRHQLSSNELESGAEQGAGIEQLQVRVARIVQTFEAKMNDDFNTSDAITALFELVLEANQYMNNSKELATKAGLQLLLDQFERIDATLGLLPAVQEVELLDADIEQLIAERVEARQAKNWARADEIRDLLQARQILLEDTPQGMKWRRK
ncbi:cysteine--tRNA ligase [Paenibacillus yanchengensis]|uniref:Cysteine--tRNA ligase n=1 Tax=Paenibacillus yanchengensis TaxID=2035833 RepID=A0ABW4YH29_9BACL